MIVIGAGIIGLSLARELKKRGVSVLVVEKGVPGHEASYAAGGMLADCADENPAVLQPLMTASAQLYPEFAHELEDESGHRVDFRSVGTILLDPARHERDKNSSRPLDDAQIAVLENSIAPGFANAFWLEESSVDPRALSAAALLACRHRGVDISAGDPVTSLAVAAQGQATGVTTDKTSFASPVVVNCAGAWACQIAGYDIPTRPRKGQMLCVTMPARDFLRHVIRSPEVYLIPRSDGRLLIGATVEDVGYDKRVDPDTIHRLRESAIRRVPGLADARLLEDWAGLRPGTPDDLPILGSTAIPGYFVATGHFRDGILLAPITAKLMAESIVDGKTGYDLSRFSAERFHSGASEGSSPSFTTRLPNA